MAEHRTYLFPLLALLIALLSSLAQAQAPVPVITQASPSVPASAPVVFEDEPLFVIYDKIGPFTPQERARAVIERLERLAKDPYAGRDTVTATDQELTSELVSGETVVMTVTERDAQPTERSRQELAKDYAQKSRRDSPGPANKSPCDRSSSMPAWPFWTPPSSLFF